MPGVSLTGVLDAAPPFPLAGAAAPPPVRAVSLPWRRDTARALPWSPTVAERTDWSFFRGEALSLTFPISGAAIQGGIAGWGFALSFRPLLGGPDVTFADATRSRALTVSDPTACTLTGSLTDADTVTMRAGKYRWWAKSVDAGREFVGGWGEVTVYDTDW